MSDRKIKFYILEESDDGKQILVSLEKGGEEWWIHKYRVDFYEHDLIYCLEEQEPMDIFITNAYVDELRIPIHSMR